MVLKVKQPCFNTAEDLHEAQMLREGAARCRDYLERRGLEQETNERLNIGYAPAGWEGLRLHLLAKRFKDVPADETRLIVRDNAIKFFGLDVQ